MLTVMIYFIIFVQTLRESGEVQVWKSDNGQLLGSLPIGVKVIFINPLIYPEILLAYVNFQALSRCLRLIKHLFELHGRP